MATSAIPMTLMQSASTKLFVDLLVAHPGLFERLGEHASKRFVFVPTDLSIAYEIVPATPALRIMRQPCMPLADVTIRGPIVVLLALLEGQADGDALFFARSIEISGDTEAVLALRNALDDNRIDLPDALAHMAGPLRQPVRKAADLIRTQLLARERLQWN